MQRTIKIIGLLAVVITCAVAAPKAQWAASCLWALLGDGSISANGATFTPTGTLLRGTSAQGSLFATEYALSLVANGEPTARRATWHVADSDQFNSEAFAEIEAVKSGDNYAGRLIVASYGQIGSNEIVITADQFGAGIDMGYGAWRLGSVIPATVQLVTDRYVQVEIGGVLVKLAVVE